MKSIVFRITDPVYGKIGMRSDDRLARYNSIALQGPHDGVSDVRWGGLRRNENCDNHALITLRKYEQFTNANSRIQFAIQPFSHLLSCVKTNALTSILSRGFALSGVFGSVNAV